MRIKALGALRRASHRKWAIVLLFCGIVLLAGRRHRPPPQPVTSSGHAVITMGPNTLPGQQSVRSDPKQLVPLNAALEQQRQILLVEKAQADEGANATQQAENRNPAAAYLLPMAAVKVKVHLAIQAHVASPGYKRRVAAIAAANLTGIIIPAGGAELVTNLLVTLKVLREHMLCRLPVEVMWQGADEMDGKTWSSITSMFAPIRGVDISQAPHPVPGLHDLPPLTKYLGKVYSLMVSEFRHVLMLDADSMPTQSPEAFFALPQYKAAGNLFWPDAWQNKVQDPAYTLHGLHPGLTKQELNKGKGYSPLDTESGQLLIDRARHLDVLEYLLWINSSPDVIRHHMWGDKDTFGLAFAAAGKADKFSQVAVPQGGIFAWRQDMLLVKATMQKEWGWQLMGFLQHDPWGRPAFVHRTINKFRHDAEPWPMQLITAPMPHRWTEYFLAHENRGPTRGVPWDYVVPANSVTELQPTADSPVAEWVHGKDGRLVKDPSLLPKAANATMVNKQHLKGMSSIASWRLYRHGSCPVASFLGLWAMQESALPVGMPEQMRQACLPVLETLLAPDVAERYRREGWLQVPTLRYLDGPHMAELPRNWNTPEAAAPIPAWRANFSDPLCDGPFVQAVKASYNASQWIRQNKALFPIMHH